MFGSMARRGAILAAATLLAILALTSVATAATSSGPAAWSGASPVDGGYISLPRPTISVTASDAAGLLSSPYYSLKVDGVLQSPSVTWGNPAHTIITLSFVPRVNLATGPHTVYASVRNSLGKYSTYTWTFTYAALPTLSSPAPAAESTVTTDGPVVSAVAGGAVTGLTQRVWVDGVEVASAYDPSTGVVSAATSGLANDAWHETTVTVTNSGGGSATLHWRFGVQVYVPMPTVSDCTSCHTTYPAAHPMSDCDACHGPGSPVGEGWTTPYYAEHSYTYLWGRSASLTCEDCHSGGYATVPALHDLSSVGSYHASSACSPCHVSELTTEHQRYGRDCMTCHGSTDPNVQAAITGHNTTCTACHKGDVLGAHEGAAAKHVSTETHAETYGCAGNPTSTWGNCHDVTDITALHVNAPDGCGSCHASSVTASSKCTDCHPDPYATHHPTRPPGPIHGYIQMDCYNACHHHDNLSIGSASGRQCMDCHLPH